ncbi:hypothetical protein VW23_012005 [Devosia insulae DS-56]|uniref:Secreted protein n=1 Tax=Devosia insulae DS-56 TaxID=1116389 RepID=A0A1E5XUU8_9HYPH|nr:hypothetical protein [Devosia insulae]OEO32359.1 hypothetical protein VW23_012005 [Devosia insulae DS-56]
MQVRIAFAALAGLIAVSLTPAVQAQTPADFTGFNQTCLAAEAFLLGEVPEGVDSSLILTPLCGCLTGAFKDMPQKDVDILAADLRGEGTDEAHTAHGSYEQVTELAREGLTTCFASPEVTAAMQAVTPPAADPAAPAPADPAAPATPQ